MLFGIAFSLTNASYQFFENDWILINNGLCFRDNILYNSMVLNFKSIIYIDWNH